MLRPVSCSVMNEHQVDKYYELFVKVAAFVTVHVCVNACVCFHHLAMCSAGVRRRERVRVDGMS